VDHASRSLVSILQLMIGKYKDKSKLMLILCGSSMSYMEDHVLAYKVPLYGRRTTQLKTQPFSFEETCQYLSGKAKKKLSKTCCFGELLRNLLIMGMMYTREVAVADDDCVSMEGLQMA